MKKPSIFNLSKKKEKKYYPDMDKGMVDEQFSQAPYSDLPKCFICSSLGHAEVFHKQDDTDIPDLPNRGFICNNCLSLGFLDRKVYKLRKLEGFKDEGTQARNP